MISQALAPSQRGATEDLTEGISVRGGPARAALLLERERELDELATLLRDAARGSGRVVLIQGPAGIGKTRLLGETCALATGLGFDVLAARGGELEREYGFGIVRQLLEAPLARADPSLRAELLAGAAELAETVLSRSPRSAVAGADTAGSVLHGLYWLVANLAERSSLLLAIDDLHWADGPSMRFLVYLARRLEGLPVVLAVATRTAEPAAAPELVQALELEAPAPVLRPGPLSDEGVATLVRNGLGDDAADELCAACADATGGNPFLLSELLADLSFDRASAGIDAAAIRRRVPERVSASLLLRVGRLGHHAPALARAVAVLGPVASVTRAARLAGVEVGEARSLSSALTDAVVFAEGEPLHFVHPIVRSAIYEDIAAGERQSLHARAARLLSAEGAEPEVVATHLLACDPDGEAATLATLREAADAALARGAPEAAARYLRRALLENLTNDVRAHVLHVLGEAECRSAAVGGIRRLRDAIDTARDPTHRGEIALVLSQALVHDGRLDEAGSILSAAIAEQPGLQHELRLALESRLAWLASLSPMTYRLYGDRLSRVVADVAGGTAAERGVLANLALRQTIEGGTATEAASLAARALGGDLAGRDISQQFAEPVLALIAAEEFALAEHHLEALLAKARAAGSLADSMLALVFRSMLEYRRGRVLQAEDDARGVLEATALGAPTSAAGAYLIHVLVERDELDEAQSVLRGLGAVGELPPNVMSSRLLLARAQLELARGELARGVADLRLLADRAKGWVDRDPANFPYRSTLAVALAGGAEHVEARALAAEELDLARVWGSPRPVGVALRALGLVEGGTLGIELLSEAVSILDASEARLEYARALVDLGAALRRSGSNGDARGPLAEGMAVAHSCGATALVERAHEELLSAGARPRRIAVTGAASLTPSERRVARLAADGMSNKEIAQALFVTLRTVEMHLSNAYAKLDIRSRHDLPRALERS